MLTLHENNIHFVNHKFSVLTIGIAGKEGNNCDYELSELAPIRNQEKILITNICNMPNQHILFLNQVHGDRVVQIDALPQTDSTWYAEADGMITSLKNICMVIRTADCIPLFIYDKKRQVTAAVHSGWKGCKLNIGITAAKKMAECYGSKKHDLVVWLLPSIGPESFEVQQDVASIFPDNVIKKNGSMYVDLWAYVCSEFIKYGIDRRNIFTSGICTYQKNSSFFSHRQGDKGRNLNFCFLG